MRRLTPVSQASFRVQIGEFDNVYFTEFSGLNGSRESSDVPTGNSRFMGKTHGLTSFEDCTLTKPMDTAGDSRDTELVDLLQRCTDEKLTITIQAVRNCPDEQEVGPELTLLNCVASGVEVSAVDRNSSDAATLTLTFTYENYSYQ